MFVVKTSLAQNLEYFNPDSPLTIIVPGDYFDGQAVYLSNQVAKKYHFQYDYIGDLQPEDDYSLIVRRNEQTDSLLNIINGPDWRQRFNDEFSRDYSRDSILILQAKSLIKSNVDTIKFKSFYAFRDSILGDNIYRVNVWAYDNHERASVLRVYFTYPKLQISSLDNKVIYRRPRK